MDEHADSALQVLDGRGALRGRLLDPKAPADGLFPRAPDAELIAAAVVLEDMTAREAQAQSPDRP